MKQPTITVRILSVTHGEPLVDLPPETLAVPSARFESIYRTHHGAGVEVPLDVDVDPHLVCGDAEAQAAHEELVPELFDASVRLDALDAVRPCYVFFEGAGGDGEDVWCRCEIVRSGDHIVVDDETYPVNTTQQIRAARAAMIRAGLSEAPVYVGSAPDAVRTSMVIFAAPASVLVSWDNGTSTEAVTGAEAEDFLARYGEQNVAALLREHDLPTEGYDSPLALLAALDTCCGAGEVPTLP